MQRIDYRCSLFLTYSPTILTAHVSCLPLNFVQAANRVQRLFRYLTFVGYMQIEKLAAGMGHAADFSDAFFKTSFVAGEVIANKLVVLDAQEVTRMPWSGLSCSLRLTNLWCLRIAISWASYSFAVSRRWIFWPIESTWDSNCKACSAKARSCSGVIWSRLGEEVMPLIVPEQAISGDKPMG
jgi:hypothetical protein